MRAPSPTRAAGVAAAIVRAEQRLGRAVAAASRAASAAQSLGGVRVGEGVVGLVEIGRLFERGAQLSLPHHLLLRGPELERARLVFEGPAGRLLLRRIEGANPG